jgi:hypothetical protein
MATIQSQLVCDSSTYANFFQWASAISAAFASFSWAQSTDTGQVMWSGMSISAVSMSGTNATYTYSGLTGLALAVGRALTITGMTNAANNGVKIITALGSGTFTVVNASGVTESGSTGAVTAQSTVPGANAYAYEIWTPNDGLQNFYVKVEYGNVGTAAVPNIRLTLSSSTTGAGVASGFIVGSYTTAPNSFTVPSTTTQYECNFSGAAGRIGVMMWRNGANSCQQFFAIERSLNSSGGYYGTSSTGHVTLLGCGPSPGNQNFFQRSLVFGVGAATNLPNNAGSMVGGWVVRIANTSAGTGNNAPFNGSMPFDTVAPLVGFADYPLTVAGVAAYSDMVEGVTFSATLYGSTRTFMPGKNGPFAAQPQNANSGNNAALCMRFD